VEPTTDALAPPMGRLIPSERLKRRQQQHAAGRRKRLHQFMQLARVGLLVAVIALWVWLPQAPFWRLGAQRPVVVTGKDAKAIAPAIQAFVAQFHQQSLLFLPPEQLAVQFKASNPMVYQIWFRRRLWPARLYAHAILQHPWGNMLHCATQGPLTSEGLSACQPWATFTDRLRLVAPQVLPPNVRPAALTPLNLPPLNAPALTTTPSANPAPASDTQNKPVGVIVPIVTANTATMTDNALPFETLSGLLQYLQAQPAVTLQWLDLRNPINAQAHFKGFTLQLGELDTDLLKKRLPRFGAIREELLKRLPMVDSVDLRWDKEITFHKNPSQKPFAKTIGTGQSAAVDGNGLAEPNTTTH
jgi:hypothetical protein